MTSPLRVAVIGMGHLGNYHAQKIEKIDQASLVAICDSSEEVLAERSKTFKTETTSDYKTLVTKVDAVIVAAATKSHYEISKYFLENKIHVFAEKPLTETVEQARELCDLAKKNGRILQVGHVERFNAALMSAQEKLKKPLFIEGHRIAPFTPRGADVDVVLDLMIHDIDLVLSLVNSEIRSISAVGTPVITPLVDIANARIEFESNAVVNLTASRVSQKSERKFRVFQQDQYLSIDFGTAEVNLTTKTGPFVSFEEELPMTFDSWSLDKGDALLEEDTAFVQAILNKTPAIVPGEHGLRALEVAEQVRADIAKRL